MEAARSIAITIGGVIALVAALAFLFAAVYEVVLGRRPPGFLGWELLTGKSLVTASWSESRWRRNGFHISPIGCGLLILAVWAFLAALKVTG